MKPLEQIIFRWPQRPPLPPPHQTVLIRVATPPSRPAERRELRAVLRQVLAEWSGLLPEQLPLRETSRGPLWPGELAGHPLGISFSYSGSEGWIGLFRGGKIGIDAVPMTPIPEAEAVARHYLGPVALAEIQNSKNPARTFAIAWSGLEAGLKCMRLELTEWDAIQDFRLQNQMVQSVHVDAGRVVAVATCSSKIDLANTQPRNLSVASV